jgi:hypothetical protein
LILEQKTRDESSIGIRRLETERNRTESEREMRMEREGGREGGSCVVVGVLLVVLGASRDQSEGKRWNDDKAKEGSADQDKGELTRVATTATATTKKAARRG